MNQVAIPLEISPTEVARKASLGAAIELCAELGGYALDKTLQQELGADKAQFSRWQSGQEGILWPKFVKLMDTCGNDAPMLWMLHQRGYDLGSLRKRESETERRLRKAEEKIARMEAEREVERNLFRQLRIAS